MGKPVASMTGFARAEANHGDWRIVWAVSYTHLTLPTTPYV